VTVCFATATASEPVRSIDNSNEIPEWCPLPIIIDRNKVIDGVERSEHYFDTERNMK
jgi:hypothetical protein